MATAEQTRLMNPSEAAEFLGLRPQTLACWRVDGRHLPYAKIGRSVKYRLADLESFIESRTIPATS